MTGWSVGNSIPGRGKSKYRGLEAGPGLASGQTRKKARGLDGSGYKRGWSRFQ